MLKSMILICQLSVAPASCNLDTATTVLQGPSASNPVQCLRMSQAYAAQMIGRLPDGYYLKATCAKRTPAPRREMSA